MLRISVKTRRLLEISANIAILIVATIVILNLVRSRWPPKQKADRPIVGSKVTIPHVHWENGPTLVMALQKGCKYCEESAPFYRRIREQRSGSQPLMLAVVPGDEDEVASYLSERGIVVDSTIYASLSDINVAATPTLFLVDRSGNVMDVWVGKLDERKETELINRVLGSHD